MICAILEDEQLSIDLLADYIARVPGLELAASFTSPLPAKRWLEAHPVDLLFLDIELPEFSGLEMLRMLGRAPVTIVTSANSRYALESYEYLVMDYLLKPFSLGRFVQAVEKVSRLQAPPAEVPPDRPPRSGHLVVRENQKHHRIPHDRLLWVESFGEYVRLHTADRTLTTLATMAQLESDLPSHRFVRVHRSRIVNLDHVEMVEGSGLVLRGVSHPVGRKYRQGLMDRWTSRTST